LAIRDVEREKEHFIIYHFVLIARTGHLSYDSTVKGNKEIQNVENCSQSVVMNLKLIIAVIHAT